MCDKMNTQLVIFVLLEYWFWYEYFIVNSITISDDKFHAQSTNNRNRAYARKLKYSSKGQRYLYLNYKEAYGLRFDPKKIYNKKQSVSNDSTTALSWNRVTDENVVVTTNGFSDIQTVSISPEIGQFETTPIANTSNSEIISTTSDTIIDDKQTSTEYLKSSNKQQVLAFSALLNKLSASNQENITSTIQPPIRSSTLRDTLNVIRNKLKQWLTFGTDTKASLINGQRFLSVFNVINFDNSPCTSAQEGLSEMSGICYHDYQCAQLGGSVIDDCADGLGVCCVCKDF